jgi:hypothetical protein
MMLANFLFRIGGTVIQWKGKDPNPPGSVYCERHNSFDFVIYEYSAIDVDYDENDEAMHLAVYICEACYEGLEGEGDFDDCDEEDDDVSHFNSPDDSLYEDYPPRFYYDAETNCYYLKPTAEEIHKRTREFFEAHGQLKLEL